jgi:hypothetical protein
VPCIDTKRSAIAVLALLAACSTPTPPPAPGGGGRSGPATSSGPLPSPGPVRNWSDLRMQAARRMVAASPGGTYTGTVPDVLLAIPVLEIELNGDGSVRRIEVLRKPGQAPETLQMAMEAVRRAAPFGDVSRLPRPWKFSETFLFNDERKFKPRTLDN